MIGKKIVAFYVVLSEVIFLWLASFSISAVCVHVHSFFHSSGLSPDDLPGSSLQAVIQSFYSDGRPYMIFFGVLVVAILESVLVLTRKGYSAVELLTIHLCVLSLQVLALFSMLAMPVYVLESAKQLKMSTEMPLHPLLFLICGFAWLIPAVVLVLFFLPGRRRQE